MAMETLHKAYFFKTEQDKNLNRAFILHWMVDEEKDRGGFSIVQPSIDDEGVIVITKYICAAEGDFFDMVRMMKLMIDPVEMIVE